MQITLDVKDSAFNEFMSIISKFKDKVSIKNEDLKDLYLLEEGKKDKTDIKTIDELLKEYNIES